MGKTIKGNLTGETSAAAPGGGAFPSRFGRNWTKRQSGDPFFVQKGKGFFFGLVV
jgi:hypothetical protein